MKKIISLAMCLILLLSLCACGKSKQAKAVEEQISTIGDVSLEKEATILSTLENYNQLSDAEKETVENYSILENAIDTISALKQAEIETALEEIETLIKQPAMDLSRDKNAEEMKWSPLEMGAAKQAHGA